MVTATIHDVRVCQSYVGTHCDETQESIPETAEQVHVTAALEKVEDGTRVAFEWAYVEYDRVILDHVDVFADSSRPMVTSMLPRPTGGWPRGSFEVTVTTSKAGGGTGSTVTQGFEIR